MHRLPANVSVKSSYHGTLTGDNVGVAAAADADDVAAAADAATTADAATAADDAATRPLRSQVCSTRFSPAAPQISWVFRESSGPGSALASVQICMECIA